MKTWTPNIHSNTALNTAILAVVAVLTAALVGQLRDNMPSTVTIRTTIEREHRGADTVAALVTPRKRAKLLPCPHPGDGPGPAVLRGVVLECASDGSAVDVARALAGRRVVLNLWASWCAQCLSEMPAVAEYQRRAGSDVTVVTVHQDENETAALLRLTQLDVRLPTLQDGRRRVAAALRVANVMPATVVLRPDGSVAQTLLRAFGSADEIAAAVGNDAG
ncbi:hypothetical protein MUBE_11415 [Mycobacterium uberis]|uniref:Thioredoxin domain-containing protein n=1 Tax=Mycobacterium uberis TaxID=2162698 RepID=A0A3E1HF24_9MYCO|nr:TlpA disulfide reductase family protein [Mycobacterium uberis]RFD25017.1 hypothetical protein MUBE_11415 [Mycobacterium uberis]